MIEDDIRDNLLLDLTTVLFNNKDNIVKDLIRKNNKDDSVIYNTLASEIVREDMHDLMYFIFIRYPDGKFIYNSLSKDNRGFIRTKVYKFYKSKITHEWKYDYY